MLIYIPQFLPTPRVGTLKIDGPPCKTAHENAGTNTKHTYNHIVTLGHLIVSCKRCGMRQHYDKDFLSDRTS
jgi:hypothetical protein